jgi:hypothetical protein
VAGAGDLDAETDQVLNELLQLEDDTLADSTVSADLAQNLVTIEVTGMGADFDEALATASSAIRTAIHAAGGATPDWTFEPRAQHAELVSA